VSNLFTVLLFHGTPAGCVAHCCYRNQTSCTIQLSSYVANIIEQNYCGSRLAQVQDLVMSLLLLVM
jgi:hypothetical protein